MTLPSLRGYRPCWSLEVAQLDSLVDTSWRELRKQAQAGETQLQLRLHTLEEEAKFLQLWLLEQLLAVLSHLLPVWQGFPWLVVLPL